MKKTIIGAILIALILMISMVSYIVISETSGPIEPYDGDEEPDGDSGDGQSAEQVFVEIKITEPAVDTYNVPDSGCEYGKFQRVLVGGYIYGTDLESIFSVKYYWEGTDYGLFEFNYATESAFCHWEQIDQYNIRIQYHILIERLGTGKHLMKIDVMNKNRNVLATASINVFIPSYWIYKWDSRNPVNRDVVIRGQNGKLYFYGFEFPYKSGITGDSNWYKLGGELVKVIGQVHGTMDCQMWSGNPKAELIIWDGFAEKWTDYGRYDGILMPCEIGWTQRFERILNTYGNAIGFSGCIDDNVDGFVGEIWIKPGTRYQTDPLSIIMNMFGRTEITDVNPIIK